MKIETVDIVIDSDKGAHILKAPDDMTPAELRVYPPVSLHLSVYGKKQVDPASKPDKTVAEITLTFGERDGQLELQVIGTARNIHLATNLVKTIVEKV